MFKGGLMRGMKRYLAVFITVTLLLCLFCSSFYLGMESQHEHHCKESKCHVCLMIKICESIVKTGYTGVSILGSFVIVGQILRISENSRDKVDFFHTLVSLKVKLSN